MVGKHGLLLGITRKPENSFDEGWNEAGLRFVGGQDAFVDAEHMKVAEIEVSGFEQSHDLQSISAAAVEFDGGSRREDSVKYFNTLYVVGIVGMALYDLLDADYRLADFAHLIEKENHFLRLFF